MAKTNSKKTNVKGHEKIKKVMKEYAHGELHSGSEKGPIVKSEKQALAIAYSEQKKKEQKRTPAK